MHYVLKSDLLDAMKDCLRDMDNAILISPEDLDIIDEKRILRRKIAKLEADGQPD
jgi:predicted ATP-grasp superfamily ATP-dependent carboligase